MLTVGQIPAGSGLSHCSGRSGLWCSSLLQSDHLSCPIHSTHSCPFSLWSSVLLWLLISMLPLWTEHPFSPLKVRNWGWEQEGEEAGMCEEHQLRTAIPALLEILECSLLMVSCPLTCPNFPWENELLQGLHVCVHIPCCSNTINISNYEYVFVGLESSSPVLVQKIFFHPYSDVRM